MMNHHDPELAEPYTKAHKFLGTTSIDQGSSPLNAQCVFIGSSYCNSVFFEYETRLASLSRSMMSAWAALKISGVYQPQRQHSCHRPLVLLGAQY